MDGSVRFLGALVCLWSTINTIFTSACSEQVHNSTKFFIACVFRLKFLTWSLDVVSFAPFLSLSVFLGLSRYFSFLLVPSYSFSIHLISFLLFPSRSFSFLLFPSLCFSFLFFPSLSSSFLLFPTRSIPFPIISSRSLSFPLIPSQCPPISYPSHSSSSPSIPSVIIYRKFQVETCFGDKSYQKNKRESYHISMWTTNRRTHNNDSASFSQRKKNQIQWLNTIIQLINSNKTI